MVVERSPAATAAPEWESRYRKMEFMRKHHMLGALVLLSAAVVVYFIGSSQGAIALIAAAITLELAGWYLVFADFMNRRDARRGSHRDKQRSRPR